MDTKQARELVGHISKLGEISASFHATFGIHYVLTEDSPDDAWLYVRQSMNAQTVIAQCLDYSVLLRPFNKWKRWWETDAIIPITLTHELFAEGFRVIYAIAYDKNRSDQSYIARLQQNIAGGLHPLARSEAIKRHPQNSSDK